jgi:septation ring formation regulator EzrA
MYDVLGLHPQAERARKNAENELHETSTRLSEVTLQVTVLTNDKRRLEGDMAAMQSDLDDAINNHRAAEVSVQ